jgi:rhamnulokinase
MNISTFLAWASLLGAFLTNSNVTIRFCGLCHFCFLAIECKWTAALVTLSFWRDRNDVLETRFPLLRNFLFSADTLLLKNSGMGTHYLACDLGAESGRVIAGTLENGRVSLQELHRFPNIPLKEEGQLRWNIPNLILELKESLRKAAALKLPFESISTDSWGVDYALFDQAGQIMSPTFHYRDGRSKAGVDRVFKSVTWEEIFAETGIQFMPINTIFQLASEPPERLSGAKFLLGIADAFNYFLTGIPKIEVSMASTFQVYNPLRNQWSDRLIGQLGFPRALFPEIVPSGSVLGSMRPELAHEVGLPELKVIATCSHDTGAAVVGVPASKGAWAYISSGTWSLIGVELPNPILSDKCRELNFTNEIGFGRSVRLLRNIIGLWIVQECRRQWQSEGKDFQYGQLTELARNAGPFPSLINPSSPEFLAPPRMATQILEFCKRTEQPIPSNEGATIRCALESLALLYAHALRHIEELTNQRIEVLHIVGGGSQNALLNQFTANACEVPVIAGPVEATAFGNILIQAMTLGSVSELRAAREVVRQSSELRVFHPQDSQIWRKQSVRFEKLLAQKPN